MCTGSPVGVILPTCPSPSLCVLAERLARAQQSTPPAGTCWTFNTTGQVAGDGPTAVSTVQGDTLYAVTSAGLLYALDQTLSTLQFQYSCPGGSSSKQASPGTLLLQNNIIYFGCPDGIFYALNALLLQLMWQYPPAPPTKGKQQTLGSFRGAPVTDGQNVYVYTQSHGKSSVVALNALSGTRLWSTQVCPAICGQPHRCMH